MNQELAVYESQPALPAVVRPLVSPKDMMDAMRDYEDLKRAIIQPSDIQKISGKDHIKKSGWLRIARAFNLSVEIVSSEYETAEDGTWGYSVVARAVAPNGASMQGDGTCWSTEKAINQRTRHNVRAHATTRASNRAISNLVGGGEVSAEEINDEEPPRRPAAPRQLPRPQAVESHLQVYPDLSDEEISDKSHKLAAVLGISNMDYGKAFYAEVNDGRPINPRQVTRAQREVWYTHLLTLKKQQDERLAEEGVEDYQTVKPDLATLDPQDVKVS